MQIVAGGNQHPRMRFTTITGLAVLLNRTLRVMRAIVDTVEVDAAVCQRPVHPFGQRFKLGFGKFTAGNTGLVSDQH
ncbi:Uncharacterised protein [Klebsiella pneumoniae]|nr:Uncharacterised protein [Klebsiella pneumoniae]